LDNCLVEEDNKIHKYMNIKHGKHLVVCPCKKMVVWLGFLLRTIGAYMRVNTPFLRSFRFSCLSFHTTRSLYLKKRAVKWQAYQVSHV
jgi:hypothetical protein